ncbi:hypothetical protein AUO94_11360 [Planococcus kocurii]|uniref:Uncharacterized protein n=1 Tax=Planococcus kocurii TaxID=1374 RepID=A0ABM5WXX0_9BACL|nr:hypothetical protein AUO94_11360 [Planococcus kocurii]
MINALIAQVKDISNYDWVVQKRAPAVRVQEKNKLHIKSNRLSHADCFFFLESELNGRFRI